MGLAFSFSFNSEFGGEPEGCKGIKAVQHALFVRFQDAMSRDLAARFVSQPGLQATSMNKESRLSQYNN